MRNKSKKIINCSIIDRGWEYSPEPRLEGLLQASKYLKWKNVESFEKLNKENKNDKYQNRKSK